MNKDTIELEDILSPKHCSSCHSEWADSDDYIIDEEPCCSRAKSNIIEAILAWHNKKVDLALATIKEAYACELDNISDRLHEEARAVFKTNRE